MKLTDYLPSPCKFMNLINYRGNERDVVISEHVSN